MEKQIIIKPSFVFKDYFKVSLYLFIFRPYFIVIILAILIIGSNIYNSKIFENQINNILFSLVLIISFFSFLLFSIYRQTKKSLSHERLKEDFNYIITNSFIEEKGESFQINHLWKNIQKITEKNNWFLLYVDKNRALIIRKQNLKDNQYNELKQLFNSIDIKKSLKS